MRGNSEHRNRETLRLPGGRKSNGRRGKANGRKPLVSGRGESDSCDVPTKHSNNGGPWSPAESAEGKRLAEGNEQQRAEAPTQSGVTSSPGLLRVREVAQKDRSAKFTALLHHVTIELLRESYWDLNRNSSAGIDGVTWLSYGEQLEERISDLHTRVHTGRYRASPSKRVYIAKEDGSQRPLGMATLEDKVVQLALVTVLNHIYESDFLGFSYGSRPGRSQHQALDALWVALKRRKVNWVLDLDFKSFYDTIDHRWLLKFLEHRIADPRVLRLIQKWLRAGVSEDGEWSETKVGTPQGAVISPLLANIYLHYVFDLWVDQWRHKSAAGELIVVRYADDAVVGFQWKDEAQKFWSELGERCPKFGLRLHPEKTRLVEFGRYARRDRQQRGEGRPETFAFLGFTHICSVTRTNGKFTIDRKTIQKRMRTKLLGIRKELQSRRHQPIVQQGVWLRSVVGGYFQYHAVPTNYRRLRQFRTEVTKAWHKSLCRRSQRGYITWDRMNVLATRWLPKAQILHDWPDKRFDARTQGKSRMR